MNVGNRYLLLEGAEKVEKADVVKGVQQGDAVLWHYLHVGGVELVREGDVRATQDVQTQVGDDEFLVGLAFFRGRIQTYF